MPDANPETTAGSRPLAAEVARRRERRKKNSEERLKALQELNKKGNELYRRGDYKGAVNEFVEAIRKGGRKAPVLNNLGAALTKLELWDEVEFVETLALQADPKHLKARERRGVARKKLGKKKHAFFDFKIVSTRDPENAIARRELNLLNEAFKQLPKTSQPDYGDEYEGTWPPFGGYADEYPSDSDTSDCGHTGNGIPCRAYNHEGCRIGAEECTYSHAPDARSIRDELGRNVCVNFLIGAHFPNKCEFGDDCVYSHDTTYLSPVAKRAAEDKRQMSDTRTMTWFLEGGEHSMKAYHQTRTSMVGPRTMNLEKDVILARLQEINDFVQHGDEESDAGNANTMSLPAARAHRPSNVALETFEFDENGQMSPEDNLRSLSMLGIWPPPRR